MATLRIRPDQLATHREQAGYKTDGALARAMGIDPGNLSRVLNGKQTPGNRFIAGLCLALGATTNDLFELDLQDVA